MGRVWQIPGNLADEVRSPSLTKEDLRKLQVLQNKCLRLVTNCDYKTPTTTLLEKTKSLSVHQHIAQLSLSQVFNIYQTKAQVYHYNRLFRKPNMTSTLRPGTTLTTASIGSTSSSPYAELISSTKHRGYGRNYQHTSTPLETSTPSKRNPSNGSNLTL